MKKHLSLSQRIHNANASQEVENVKGRHAYLHARVDAVTEYMTIWQRSDDITWAHAFGRMRGFDEVWNGLTTVYSKLAMRNWLELVDIYPEVSGKDPHPLLETAVHTLATDVIEVADDGMSARGSFITPGVIFSTLNPEQKKSCGILWERYGSDFVNEDDVWKYIGETICPDIRSELDEIDWAMRDYMILCDPSYGEALPLFPDLPHVTDPGPLHFAYSALQPPQDHTPCPEPYVTMDKDHRYHTEPEGR